MNDREAQAAAQCQGKQQLTAEWAQRIIRRGSDRRKGAVAPYKCPICRAWHIGSKPKWHGKVVR